MPYAIMPEPKVKYFRLIFHRKIDSKTNTWYDTLVSLVSFLYHTLIFIAYLRFGALTVTCCFTR